MELAVLFCSAPYSQDLCLLLLEDKPHLGYVFICSFLRIIPDISSR